MGRETVPGVRQVTPMLYNLLGRLSIQLDSWLWFTVKGHGRVSKGKKARGAKSGPGTSVPEPSPSRVTPDLLAASGSKL